MALNLPVVGADVGTWGGKLNTALAALDSAATAGAAATAAIVAGATRDPLPHLGDVDNLAAVGVATPTTWETYDGSGVIVHPSVRFLPKPLSGSQWWAAATPYPSANSDYENPSIFVSDDGITWAAPDGVTNPLVPQPAGDSGQNSDANLVVGPDGRLHIFYRTEIYATSAETLSVISSDDGITWSEPVVLLNSVSATRSLVSPAVWWDVARDEWVMLTVDLVPDPRVIRRFTTPTLTDTWTEDASAVSVPAGWPSTVSPWHLEAVAVGTQVVAVIQSAVNDGDGGDLWLTTSDDGGRTLTRATSALLRGTRYKASLLPVMTETGLGLRVWAGNQGGDWGAVHYDVRARQPDLAPVLAAAAIPPYVAGDAFARANGTSLGSAPTGQAWAVDAGGFSIASNKATPTTSANNKVSLDVGVADYEVTTYLHALSASTSCWLTARIVDAATYFRLGFNWGFFQLQRIGGGNPTLLSVASAQTEGKLTLRCKGSRIIALLDDVVVFDGTDSQGSTATKVGFQADDPGSTYGYLAVKAL